MIPNALRRPAEGVFALLAYLGQIARVIGGLSLRSALGAASWLVEDGLWIFKTLVVAVMTVVAIIHRDTIVEIAKFAWAHEKTRLVYLVYGAFKSGVAIVAILGAVLAISVAAVAIAIVLTLVPFFVIGEVVRALARGIRVAWLAARSTKVGTAAADSPENAAAVLCQISDLHISAPGLQPYEIEVAPGHWPLPVVPSSERLQERVIKIVEAASEREPRCPVIVTGDVTDTGSQDEWDVVVGALGRFGPRILLAPGNHDISINRSAEPDFKQEKRRGRQQRFLTALRRLQPQVSSDYDDVFPIERALDRNARLFILDSNRYPSRYVLSNAVGFHGREQLDRLAAKLLGSKSRGPVVIATHHHIARFPGEKFSFEDAYMIAIDGSQLLSVVDRYQREDPSNRVLILHGHRHVEMRGSVSDRVLICGHPSSTLGHSGERLDGKARYASVHLSGDGRWSVALHVVDAEMSVHAQQPAKSVGEVV